MTSLPQDMATLLHIVFGPLILLYEFFLALIAHPLHASVPPIPLYTNIGAQFLGFGVLFGVLPLAGAAHALSRVSGRLRYALCALSFGILMAIASHPLTGPVGTALSLACIIVANHTFPWHLPPFRYVKRSTMTWVVGLLCAFAIQLIPVGFTPLATALSFVGLFTLFWLIQIGPAPARLGREGRGIGPPGSNRLFAAAGQAGPNDVYFGQRLVYASKPEPSFDPMANSRYVIALLRAGLALGVIVVVGFVVITVEGAALHSGLMRMEHVSANWLAIAWIAFLTSPVPLLLSEWKLLIEDKAKAAASAFQHVAWALERRGRAVAERDVRIELPNRQSRDYLELRDGDFCGFISCFGHGRDLYVGWTFWLYLSPSDFIWLVLSRIWRELRLRGSNLYVTLSYERPAGMREAMHGAAREGLDAAIEHVRPQNLGTLGARIPVETFPPVLHTPSRTPATP